MKMMQMTQAGVTLALLLGAAPLLAAQVVELTQTPCQFLESEGGVDHGYQSQRADDCVAINKTTAPARLEQVQDLMLPAGDYVFRVSNKNVPYELGFWLRGAGLVGYAALPSVSGGGLTMGNSQDYQITLKPGEYVYSCPLNPTPDYRLTVTE